MKYMHDAAKAAIEEPGFVSLMNARGVDIEYESGDKRRADLWKEYRSTARSSSAWG